MLNAKCGMPKIHETTVRNEYSARNESNSTMTPAANCAGMLFSRSFDPIQRENIYRPNCP
jgi:hypothetical protein